MRFVYYSLIILLLLAGCTVQPQDSNSSIGLELVANGFDSPVYLTSPSGDDRLFVVDQTGVIKIIKEGALLSEPFLDMRNEMVSLNPVYDERGLLGLAFHPNFSSNGLFYVYYSSSLRTGAPSGWSHTSRISEFKVSSNPDVADASSERIVLEVDEPQSNHNGGTLVFGPDGYLYISLGDGGAANDEGVGHYDGNGQNLSNLLGSILRIDVSTAPYSIPSDNPFGNEIFAYGLRNPYRISFDAAGSHELFAGDAGQNLYEEVDVIVKGGNYGWNIMEASHCFKPSSGCSTEGLIDPVIEYPHSGGEIAGSAVINGYIYRGSNITSLYGDLIFGDYNTGSFRGSLFKASTLNWSVQRLDLNLDGLLLGFGQDNNNELYVLTSTGSVYKIVSG